MNITTRNTKIQTTDNKIQARDKSFKPFGVYRNAVLSLNSTQIASDVNTRLLYKWLIDNNLYDDLVFAVGGEYGIQKNYIDPNWQIENAYDLSKFGNNAGQGTAADQPILENNIFKHDGISDHLKVNSSPELNSNYNEFTVFTWINYSVANQPGNGSYGYIIHKGISQFEGNAEYVLSIINAKIRWQIFDGNSRRDMATTEDYNDGKWHLVMGVWDGAYSRLYIDVNQYSELEVSSFVNSDTLISIGSSHASPTYRPYQGNANDIGVVKKAFSASQVLSFYNFTKSKYGY